MKTLFITAGDITVASSRMRAYWVAEHLQGADVVPFSKLSQTKLSHYDAAVWQKVLDPGIMRATPHVRHYYDACDPSWWWEPEFIKTAVEMVTAVVCSNEALADDFIKWWKPLNNGELCIKVYLIPDLLNLTHFPLQRQHTAVSPVRFIWFGHAANRVALIGALANLERLAANGHKIELTIMDNAPHEPVKWTNYFPIYHVPWSLKKENEILASHDVAILPPYPGAWGWVKSNNKRLTAAACGLVVTDGMSYNNLAHYVENAASREEFARHGIEKIKADGDVRLSAQEWQVLLSEGSE